MNRQDIYQKGTLLSVPFVSAKLQMALLPDLQVIHREGAVGNGKGPLENGHAAL